MDKRCLFDYKSLNINDVKKGMVLADGRKPTTYIDYYIVQERGVVTTPCGAQYIVARGGDGSIHYMWITNKDDMFLIYKCEPKNLYTRVLFSKLSQVASNFDKFFSCEKNF